MGDKVSFPVFKDRRGNRLVFPGLYGPKYSRTVLWERGRVICMSLGLSEEADTLDLETDDEGMLDFPHAVASAGHSGFAHGSDTVWLISGPEFDSCVAQGEP